MNTIRATLAAATACVLSACGGGGDSGGGGAVLQSAGPSPSATSPTSGNAAAMSAGPAAAMQEDAAIAKAGDAGSGDALRPLVQSPFPREHTYRFFSANGTEQLLRLDFPSRRFELLGAGASTSGTFSEDAAEPGTFAFTSARTAGGYNAARFRLVGDAVIGAFPVTPAYGSPQRFETQSFIAAKTFVTEGTQIDGSFAPLEINRAPTGEVGGGVISTRITNAGTRMTTCMSSTPYTIETCPSGVLRTYTLQQNGDIWHATSTVNSRDQFDFSVALIGGERVYLNAGTFRDLMDLGGPERTGLRVGMPAINEDWPLSYGMGVSVGGSWGNYALDGLRLRATVADPWGQVRAVTTTVQAAYLGYLLPNVRSLNSTEFAGYAIQNKSLFLAWGAPSGSQPALSVAQVAGVAPDKRTGAYLAFGFDGQLYSLQFDFGARTYTASRDDGAALGSGTMNFASAFGGYQLRDTAMTSPASEAVVIAANDSVIGNLPLVDPSTGIVRRVPFVAVRNFVTQQSDLTVLPRMHAYWFSPDLGVANLPPVYQSIASAGASIAICPWTSPDGVPPESCPAQSAQTMVIAPGTRAGAWRATRLNEPPGSGEDFYVARIGADYVYLSAANGLFKIGLDISASAPRWGTIATSGTQAAASSNLPSSYQNFGCFGSGVTDCFRFFAYPMDAFRFNDAVPTGAPIRRATFANQPGTYTFHQGRNLLVMHGRTPSIVELGIGMAP